MIIKLSPNLTGRTSIMGLTFINVKWTSTPTLGKLFNLPNYGEQVCRLGGPECCWAITESSEAGSGPWVLSCSGEEWPLFLCCQWRVLCLHLPAQGLGSAQWILD